ncbi:MAG: polysaccharide biosynthesis protein [Ignavibacteriales bacterium]|nr:polysaccharide biosynthesis protein [Ignavibacteriales bacterium]
MPGIYELLGGKVSVNRLREVDITDLLRRDHVRVNDEKVGQALEGKRVLVTGAGGSIGRELSRQIARRNPAELVLLGHGENSIFEILLELQGDYPNLETHPRHCRRPQRAAPRLSFQQASAAGGFSRRRAQACPADGDQPCRSRLPTTCLARAILCKPQSRTTLSALCSSPPIKPCARPAFMARPNASPR